MPVYEYECPEHGRFELLQDISAGTSRLCPKCGVESNRVVSKVTFRIVRTERPPYDATERVYDRQRLMRDTKVKKALREYREETFSKVMPVEAI